MLERVFCLKIKELLTDNQGVYTNNAIL